MAMFVKLSGYIPTLQKTFFRNAISMLIAFGFVLHYKERFFGKRENQKYLLLRSALGATGVLLNVSAIDDLVLSDADIFSQMCPFITITVDVLFFIIYV